MAQFAYKARKRSGELSQGIMEASDRSAALALIQKQGLFPLSVEAQKNSLLSRKKPAKKAAPKKSPGETGAEEKPSAMPLFLQNLFNRQRSPKLQEMARYLHQLANLIKSGMPLTMALKSASNLDTKGIPKTVTQQLKQDVMEGRNLSDAMAKQPNIFSNLTVSMVRAGEQSGALLDVLRRLAEHYTRFAEVQSKFKSAMIYPAIVASVGVIIIFFFMSFMLPKFMEIFEGLQVELPPSTQALMTMSQLFENYWWLMGIVILAVGVIFSRFKASDSGRRVIDRWKLNVPVLGKVFQMNVFGQFARTLSTLLKNGVPVLTALSITEKIISNVIIQEAIAKTREEVTDGKTIAQPLARSGVFPQLMIDLLKIGEDTGDVPGSLENVAETYESELIVALRTLTNLIEPILIILMAVGVGGLLFSILSAMFAITSNIAR